jgi:serine/threonine-protein kinase
MGARSSVAFEQLSKSQTARHVWSGLTPDMLERVRSRVKAFAWFMLIVNVLGVVVDGTYFLVQGRELDVVLVGTMVVGAVLGVALVVVATRQRFSHVTVLYAALAFEVLICLDLAVMLPWFIWLDRGHLPVVTWVEVLLVLFPLIVPAPPRLMAVTLALSAATRVVALRVLELGAGLPTAPGDYFMAVVAPAFAAGMAYAAARIVYGMTVEAAEARRMGSYQLTEQLGSGGMGEVWRAEHRLLARPAAVKLVRVERLAGKGEEQRVVLQRFEREAQATALLRSPHTIELYDFGFKDDGTLYYVMELLDGLDLDRMVRRFGPVDPARAAHLVTQACDSLGEAHGEGLIHRDVKPANLYVCRYGRRVDFVKVLDFGLVKQRDHGSAADDVNLTAENTVSGTPAFLAPEQVMGGEVDGQADVYALGCVLYWVLTGQYVFDERSVMATMMAHVQAMPERPSARTEQPIPGPLDDLVLECLAKSPGDRPQGVDLLAERLASIPWEHPWTEACAREWWNRHLPDL